MNDFTTMFGIVATMVSIIFGVTGGIIGVSSFAKNNKKSIKEETKEETKDTVGIKSKLDYIAKGVDDIRLDLKDHARQINGLSCELAELRENCKSAHKRIDKIENKEGVLKNE